MTIRTFYLAFQARRPCTRVLAIHIPDGPVLSRAKVRELGQYTTLLGSTMPTGACCCPLYPDCRSDLARPSPTLASLSLNFAVGVRFVGLTSLHESTRAVLLWLGQGCVCRLFRLCHSDQVCPPNFLYLNVSSSGASQNHVM